MKHCLEHNVRSALNAEGGRNGFKEVVTRGHEQESIEIEIQFRMEIAGYNRLVTYSLEIDQDKKGMPFVRREILRYKRGSASKPFHFLYFQNGEGSTQDKIRQLYLVAFSRAPLPGELAAAEAHIQRAETDATRKRAFENILWALVNTKEFLFNH